MVKAADPNGLAAFFCYALVGNVSSGCREVIG